MAAKPLRRTQLTVEVARYLRSQIMTGALRPGSYIRIDDTASTLGCSATPVREALVTLRGEGLVDSSPHRGFVVEPLDYSDIVDIFWVQAELSSRLATRAARNSDLEAQLAILGDLVEDLRQAVEARDTEAVLNAEFAFHRQVNLMANSSKLAWFLRGATKYSPHELYAGDYNWGLGAVASHLRLIDYLRAGDEAAIVEEIHARFAEARDRLADRLTEIGFWAASESEAAVRRRPA